MTHEEKAKYHEIMVATWRIFTKERLSEAYSDTWWEEIIGEYNEYKENYKETTLEDYCGELAMAFLNEHERCIKRERTNGDIFMERRTKADQAGC